MGIILEQNGVVKNVMPFDPLLIEAIKNGSRYYYTINTVSDVDKSPSGKLFPSLGSEIFTDGPSENTEENTEMLNDIGVPSIILAFELYRQRKIANFGSNETHFFDLIDELDHYDIDEDLSYYPELNMVFFDDSSEGNSYEKVLDKLGYVKLDKYRLGALYTDAEEFIYLDDLILLQEGQFFINKSLRVDLNHFNEYVVFDRGLYYIISADEVIEFVSNGYVQFENQRLLFKAE